MCQGIWDNGTVVKVHDLWKINNAILEDSSDTEYPRTFKCC